MTRANLAVVSLLDERDIASDSDADLSDADDTGDLDADADVPTCPDLDGDGHPDEACGGTDCNDAHPAIHPDAEEICDGVDNNCVDGVDEGFPTGCLPCTEITHAVCPPGDVRSCSRHTGALAVASDCDEIWLSGTLTLLDTVTIDAPIHVYGGFDGDETERSQRESATHVTTIDGGGTVHCFSITAGTLFDGVTVANCLSDDSLEGGAIDVRGAALHLCNTVFEGNRAWGEYWADYTYGGAVFVSDGAAVSIEDSRFENNTSHWNGGAIAIMESSDLLVHDTRFIDNHTDEWNPGAIVQAFGGALYAESSGTITLTGSTFEGNGSWADGDAIYAYDTTIYILGCEFRDNVTNNIVVIVLDSVAVVHGSVFEGTAFPTDRTSSMACSAPTWELT